MPCCHSCSPFTFVYTPASCAKTLAERRFSSESVAVSRSSSRAVMAVVKTRERVRTSIGLGRRLRERRAMLSAFTLTHPHPS